VSGDYSVTRSYFETLAFGLKLIKPKAEVYMDVGEKILHHNHRESD